MTIRLKNNCFFDSELQLHVVTVSPPLQSKNPKSGSSKEQSVSLQFQCRIDHHQRTQNGEENACQNLCFKGELFWIYLTTILGSLNGSPPEALNKKGLFSSKFWKVFISFLQNVARQRNTAWSQVSKSLSLVRNGQWKKLVWKKRAKNYDPPCMYIL